VAKKSTEDEWWEAFGYMSPEEQQATMAEMGYVSSGSGTQDPGFSYFGSGLDDYPLEGIAATPEFTTKGALDPRDLTQVAKGINVAQDYGSLLVDNALTGLAGPGSYDIGAFTPEVEYGKEIVPSGRNRLESYAGRGGWEGFIANEIMKGGTPSSAMASLQQFLENTDPNDPDLSPEEKTQYESLTNSLPRNTGDKPIGRESEDLGFWADYDYDRLYNTANEYSDAIFKDDPYGYEEVGPDGKTRYYDKAPEEIKTPQMEFFDKYGLPYPTKSYEDPQYLQAMLDAEEGTTPEYREAEGAKYLEDYGGIVKKNEEAQALLHGGQRAMEEDMLKAWEDAQPEPLATRMATTTVPGSAGVEYGRERGASPNAPGAATIRGTADQATLPTTVLQPRQGQVLANPQWGTNPASGIGAGKTWAYTNDQGQMFADNPAAPQNLPQVRALANGLMGVVQPGTARSGWAETAFNPFGTQPVAEDREFSAFTNPKGSKTRAMTAKDVDMKARTKRASETNKKAQDAWYAQREAEASDPRLNDIKRAAELYLMAQSGRTPYKDAMSQRRLGAQRLGL
jgi:hypothetical protein